MKALFIIGYVIAGLRCLATTPEATTAADRDWNAVGADRQRMVFEGVRIVDAKQAFGGETPQFYSWWARERLNLRTKGWEFWHRYPDDPRKYTWLSSTVNNPPPYWKDIETAAKAMSVGSKEAPAIDRAAIDEWNAAYLPMRTEYMASSMVTDEQRAWFRKAEYEEQIDGLSKLRGSDLHDRALVLFIQVSEYFERLPDKQANNQGARTLARFFSWTAANILETAPALGEAMLVSMQLSSHQEIRSLAEGYQRLHDLRKNPPDVLFTASNGSRIDLSQLRGKVVLIDVWANTCSMCISSMPGLQRIYERFKSAGFEIVGVWVDLALDEARQKELWRQAQEITRRQGATWPQIPIPGKDSWTFMERYSVVGVPQTWLFDKQGKLIASHVSDEQLERLLPQLLSQD